MFGIVNSYRFDLMKELSVTLNGANGIKYNGETEVSLNITAASIGAAASNHTHNYAGSSSAGGNANAAVKLATARKIGNASFNGTADITVAAIGAAAASHTHSYLPLSGGTMTGNVSYNMYGGVYTPLQVFGGDVNGLGILLSGCGCTIVGSGEIGSHLRDELDAKTESLNLGADGDINLYTNGNTYANKLTVRLDTGRNFFPLDNNAGAIGKSNCRWGTGYFNKLNISSSLTIIQPTSEAIANCPPSIIFTNDAAATQQVWIKYSDYDVYKRPAGLTICGQQGKEYLIVDGDITSNNGVIKTTTQIIFESGTNTSGNLRVNASVPNESGTNVTVARYPLKWWGNEQNGLGVAVGDGGATILGAGEAGDALKTALNISGGTETVFIASDGPIRFFTNCQTIANRIESIIDTAGKFTTKTLNATTGYQFNGAAGKLTATQSGAPNTNMVWAW